MTTAKEDSTIADEDLLAAMASGDASAARRLSARLAPVAFRVAYRMLGDRAEAEDVAQESLLRLWRIAPDWRTGNARVTTWLYRVASNLATDRLRRNPSLPIDAVPEPVSEERDGEQMLIEADRARALDAAILTLPDRQRQAIVLRYLEGLGNIEISEIMDLGVEAVESLLSRGKRGLKLVLSPQKEELGYGNA
ncbi:MAG: sigma-70 family RNA polymerase sigma factor [Rhodobacteraceae bacterium]|nr:sigma-70 family RNA polymerase sigma factor [Paracoccaceae bacterium]